jgi:CubicO group peptidase (beta-lactamase class C family)
MKKIKNRAVLTGLIIGAAFAQPAVSQAPNASLAPSDSVIRQILIDRIDKYQQSVGIVVGVIEPRGRRVVAHGALDQGNPQPLDGDTVFEIGSVTKVFTSLLLAEMVQRGEVSLDDPVAKCLPPEVKVPERGGRQITLQDLATHTSGLPGDPSNISPRDPANPLADYSAQQLYAFLSNCTLTSDVGSRYGYSNLGTSVLGQALAHHAGMHYEALLELRILKPLGMSRTRVSLSQEMKSGLAPGHSYMLERLPNWDAGALAPSGGLKSTANDLLKLLSVALGYGETPLTRAMATTMSVRRPAIDPDRESALGWDVLKLEPVYEFIFKDGATGGYRSFVGVDRRSRSGVVVLSNAATGGNIVDIGMHLLNPEIPLESAQSLVPPRRRVATRVDTAVLSGYVGRYGLPRGNTLTITLDGDQLYEQRNGELKVPIYPENRLDFFCKLFDEQITFKVDSQGLATGLTYVRDGRARQAQRIR